MCGHIDQIDSVVHFERRQMLDTWDKQIQSLCLQVLYLRIREERDNIYNHVVAGEQCDWQDHSQGGGVAQQDHGVADGRLSYDRNSFCDDCLSM